MIAIAEKKKKAGGNDRISRMVTDSTAGIYEFFEQLTTFEKLAILLFYYSSVLNNEDSDNLLDMLCESVSAETAPGEEELETAQLRGMVQGVLFFGKSMNL
jgi:hypothetical protein